LKEIGFYFLKNPSLCTLARLAAASLYGKACITSHLICKFWQKFCTLAKAKVFAAAIQMYF
jgi:hypothetical protein